MTSERLEPVQRVEQQEGEGPAARKAISLVNADLNIRIGSAIAASVPPDDSDASSASEQDWVIDQRS